MSISVLLVDDAPDVRRMLSMSLRARGQFEVVGEASTGAEACDLAGRLRPDVIVLDLGLPDLAGKDLLAQVRRTAPTSRNVIFSGSDTDRTWFERRAAGYVLKDEEVDQLVDLLASVGTSQSHDEAAVEHARTECQLVIARTDNGVRLEVRDAGAGMPQPRPPSADAEDGRGLLIIAALSTAWGIDEAAPDGKTVWVELATTEPAA